MGAVLRCMGAVAVTFAITFCGFPCVLAAQSIEISPMAGYRFGGGFFELETGQSTDRDGAPAIGAVVDVPLWEGLQAEALFSHQGADVLALASFSGPARRWHVVVEQFHGGGLQEFGDGRVRPFLTGTLGLTRYAAPGDNELRFALAAGGGVKLFPWSIVGVRLDGRVFSTIVDADIGAVACGRGCFTSVHVDAVWQAEFTAGLVVRLR